MKRIIAMAVCITLIAAAAIGSTIAYLTDTDEDTNTFTVGNVIIVQHEQERGDDGLQDYQNRSDLRHPMVEHGEKDEFETVTFPNSDGEDASVRLRNHEHDANYVDKIVTVENKGKSDAYVRNIIAIPTGDTEAKWLEFDWFDADTGASSEWAADSVVKGVQIEGVTYDIYVYNHTEALRPGAKTLPTLLGFGLSKNVDYDKNTDKYYYFENGVRSDISIDPSEVKIYVATQATQAAGFDSAKQALDTAFDPISKTSHPWADKSGSCGEVNVDGTTATLSWSALKEAGYVKTKETDDGKTLLYYISPEVTALCVSGEEADIIGINEPTTREALKLETLVIGSGIERIGTYAFNGCSSLTSVTFPSTPLKLEHHAFGGTGLKEVTIPSNVTLSVTATQGSTSNAYGAQFYGCTALEKVVIKSGATALPQSCFYGCSALKSVTLPDTITEIQEHAFTGCSSLRSIDLPDQLETLGKQAFNGCTALEQITVPQKVTKIENCTFQNCSSLTSVTLPEGLKTIGNEAFSFCTSLDNVIVPKGVTEIGYQAFRYYNGSTIKLPAYLKGEDGKLSDANRSNFFDNRYPSVTFWED